MARGQSVSLVKLQWPALGVVEFVKLQWPGRGEGGLFHLSNTHGLAWPGADCSICEIAMACRVRLINL